MKIGISVPQSGAKMALPMARILRAEALGLDAVWCFETYGSDALTPLAYIAALTRRIRLGTGIAQLAARTPAAMAMAAQTIDAMAGGDRMIVGLGVSGPQIVEGWYGQPWGSPNHRLRDYVAIMKKIWRREGPVSHQGREISLPYTGPGASGLGKPLKSIMHGNPRIPVFLGTMTPVNVRMTAEIADGWACAHVTPTNIDQYLPLIDEGLARRTDGLTRAGFTIRAVLQMVVNRDVRAAIAALKPHVALYAGGMGAREVNFHKQAMIRNGHGAAAERIQELFLAGRREEAIAAVPDDYVDDEHLIGPPERIRERWRAWADSAIDMVTFTVADDDALELVGTLARE